MDDTTDKHWRDVSENSDDKNNIHSLRWEVYVKEKEDLINIELLVSNPHHKGGSVLWTCVKYHIIKEK